MKLLVRLRPLLGEVQVGDEERAHTDVYFLAPTSVIDSMTTGWRGTSLVHAAGAGRRLGDLRHHVHARHHLAEHRVAPAVLAAG